METHNYNKRFIPEGDRSLAYLVLFAGAIGIIMCLIPYALLALIPASIIYSRLKNKYLLSYGNTFLATFFSTFIFNFLLYWSLYALLQYGEKTDMTTITGLVILLMIFIVLLMIFSLFSSQIFYLIIKKRIEYTVARKYTLFLVLPLNILFHLIALVLLKIFMAQKFGIHY